MFAVSISIWANACAVLHPSLVFCFLIQRDHNIVHGTQSSDILLNKLIEDSYLIVKQSSAIANTGMAATA